MALAPPDVKAFPAFAPGGRAEMLMFSNITGADLGFVSRITARALFCDLRSSLRGALSHQCKLIGLWGQACGQSA